MTPASVSGKDLGGKRGAGDDLVKDKRQEDNKVHTMSGNEHYYLPSQDTSEDGWYCNSNKKKMKFLFDMSLSITTHTKIFHSQL